MAIEAFIPTTDAKLTVEKKVKEKLTEKDLVTIESPGRPVEASNLESPSKKPRKAKPAKAAQKETTIRQPKRDSIVIITEKPQAALKIASSLSSSIKKYSENNVPFYELERKNEKIIVCSAVGHLFNLTYAKGQVGWPVFKTEWIPSFEGKGAAYTKNYYNVLKKVVKRAKEIVIATDYDIEGETIGWNVLRFIANTENAKRMKFSTLTKDELLTSYENPMPTLDWGQAYAGETRHVLDWLYGINLSRALMSAIKKAGNFKILSIGRVQGPALKIIVDRDREISAFKSQPYWQVLATTPEAKEKFMHPKDIFDKKELEHFKDIKHANAETTEKEEIIKPPFPFDLTSLQREAHAHHNISPSRTLQVAQALYLDGLISYPRTSSQKIPFTINPKEILRKLRPHFQSVVEATRSTPIEGPKSDPAHPSIYPTGDFKSLSEDEKKVYELIVKRFISAFSPDARTANKKITLTAKNGKTFVASGLNVIEPGWTKVYPVKMDERSLPDLKGPVNIDKIDFVEKETQPPKRYTAASLITILEKKNLGTKTTRSLIIDTLFDRGYLDGKSIKATALGEKLIESLEKFSPIIIDENLTRNLEDKIEELQEQKDKASLQAKELEIVSNAERVIADISKDFKAHELEIGKQLLSGLEIYRQEEKENNALMPCPVCKEGKLTIKFSRQLRRNFVACDRYPNCKTTFSLPPNALIKKTEKMSERNLPILMAIRKGKRPWEFEFNPNWKAEHAQQQNQQGQDNQNSESSQEESKE